MRMETVDSDEDFEEPPPPYQPASRWCWSSSRASQTDSEYQKNGEQYGVQMTLPDQADFVSMEVKDQHSFSNKDLWIVASKLFSSPNQKIGIVIVQNCWNYWSLDVGNVRPATNKTRVYNLLKHIEGEKVGQVYFIRSDSAFETKALGDGAQRLILIQVACLDPKYWNILELANIQCWWYVLNDGMYQDSKCLARVN